MCSRHRHCLVYFISVLLSGFSYVPLTLALALCRQWIPSPLIAFLTVCFGRGGRLSLLFSKKRLPNLYHIFLYRHLASFPSSNVMVTLFPNSIFPASFCCMFPAIFNTPSLSLYFTSSGFWEITIPSPLHTLESFWFRILFSRLFSTYIPAISAVTYSIP